MNTTVTCEWLKEHLNDNDIIILDASPKSNVSGLENKLENLQIPNARCLDLANDFSLPNAEFPNTFPTVTQFEKAVQQLGINSNSILVIYDNLGIYSSPRVWWMFQTMGHQQTFVLDGGLPEWVAKGYETTSSIPTTNNFTKGNFKANFDAEQVKDFTFMESNILSNECLVIDARSKGRFEGAAPEPRAGLRSGAIPNSINLPFQEFLNEGKLKTSSELQNLFQPAKTSQKPLIFSCGSGLTACIILLAAARIGLENSAVYDGSWTEWATKKPIYPTQ